jgi:phosphoglycerate dehydrogenase-like enzyme
MQEERTFPQRWTMMMEHLPGIYGSTVGIVSLGLIGRGVCERLKPFGVKVIAYDPFVSETDAAALNVELCSLEDIFCNSDVVSLHTPLLKETERMITGAHFASMRPWASFINTSRGAIVREQELIQTLQSRTDLLAILDVTHPEPPVPESPLYTLPNVVLTPHISGAASFRDIARMGKFVLDELQRYLQNEPLRWEVTREKAMILA